MAEWQQLISEWLNEYATLQENEIKSFAAEHEHNHEIATAIFNLFYSEDESEADNSNKIENDSQFEQVSTIYKISIIHDICGTLIFIIHISFGN